MKIKGTSILNTISFVKANFSERYDEWFDALPEETQLVFKDIILSSHWYDLDTIYLVPLRKVGEVFYQGNEEQAARDIGKSSVLKALKGVYKIFVKVASVDFVVKRATTIFSTYYEAPAKIIVVESEKKYVKTEIRGFKSSQSVIFHGIVGWLDGLFSIIVKNKYTITFDVENIDAEEVVAKILIKFE